jgi:hypothetical protein
MTVPSAFPSCAANEAAKATGNARAINKADKRFMFVIYPQLFLMQLSFRFAPLASSDENAVAARGGLGGFLQSAGRAPERFVVHRCVDRRPLERKNAQNG